MFERFYDIIDYLFPVYIIRRDDVLSIEDRRPTGEMLLCGSGTIILTAAVVVFVWNSFNETDFIKFAIPALAIAVFLGYRALTRTFREIYVFDKSKDTYWFTRQSVLRKEVIQGSASQFRAAEVIRQTSSSEDGTTYTYPAALLQQPGLLLGTDEAQILREDAPIFNTLQAETRIVAAISSFLSVTNNNMIDSL